LNIWLLEAVGFNYYIIVVLSKHHINSYQRHSGWFGYFWWRRATCCNALLQTGNFGAG